MSDEVEEVEEEEVPERTVDDMLEDCYNKLSILEEDLKAEINAYFIESGRWEEPYVPDPVNSLHAETVIAEAQAESLKKPEDRKPVEEPETESEVTSDFQVPAFNR